MSFGARRRSAAVGGILLLMLAGCAGVPQQPPVEDPLQVWHARERQLRGIMHWEVRGRLAVRTRDEGFNANFLWRQWGENYHIRLSGPFGMAALTVAGNEEGVALRRDGKTAFHRGDAETLFFRQTGVRLPIDALRYWVRGIPQPGVKAKVSLDRRGRLQTLQQAGWEIDYRRYVHKRGLDLPAKLVVENPQVRVRIVIDRWILPSPAKGRSTPRRTPAT